MKATSLHRRLWSRGARRREDRGVAIVTVLAVLLLMSVLVMSFFEMAKTEVNASVKDSENIKARSYADAAVNIAIAQIREATTQRSATGEYAPWSSQPGAIRVYQPYGDLKAIYKLYSSARMVADSLQQLERDDIRKDWDSEPHQWVDPNAPVVIPSISDEKDSDQSEVYFPIADPRAARAQARDSVEGFKYKDAVNGVVPPSGGRANSQRLPMPVRWLYLLADGTVGTLSKAGEFVSSTGGGAPTKENPIVGRIAFWTDDETCKINVNTASEGVYWDTPRANTEEDRWLGQSQPVSGEVQRYPGHPAMVCMSSVLFPNKRFKALISDSASPTGGGISMEEMHTDEIKAIWRMSPYIYGEDDDDSSFGGRRKPSNMSVAVTGTNNVTTLVGEPNPKHLYNSYDDYLVASISDAKIGGTAKDIEVKERTPVGDSEIRLPVDRIQQGRFFLTTRSSAPEISLGSLPRVSLWPIDNTVVAELANSRSTLGSRSRFSIYDTLVAFNTSLRQGARVQPFFFQRQDVNSRHAEFYTNSGGRNKVLWDYLTKAFLGNIPGFGLRKADPSGANFQNFADKYGGTRYDDLPAITAQMVDYMRNQNLSDGNLAEASRYVQSSAYGQVTPICCCGGTAEHERTWFIASSPSPKGVGRFLTVSEVALVVGLRAKMTAGAASPQPINFHPDNRNLVGSPPAPGTDFYEIEAGLLIEAFSTAQGWSEYRPQATFTLGGFSGGGIPSQTVANMQAGTQDRSIGKMDLCGKQLVYDGTADSSAAVTSAGPPPKDWIAWGGTLGVRATQRMITFKPILFAVPAGQQLPPFRFSGTLGSGSHLRLIVYDQIYPTGTIPDAAAPVDTGNLIQFIPLAFPENNGGYPLPTSHPRPFRKNATGDPASVVERMQEARANGVLYGTNGLIHPGDIVQSLVPNHGDFRLLAAKRAVMQGRSSGKLDAQAKEYPTFVAHPNYGLKGYPLAHSLREPKPEKSLAIPSKPVPGLSNDFGYFTKDGRSVDLRIRPEYLPDFPIKPWEDKVNVKVIGGLSVQSLGLGAISGGKEMTMPMRDVFNITRYDHLSGSGSSARYKRGAAQPDITLDFDTGTGPAMDGPYTNHGDDGEVRGALPGGGGAPYFSNLDATSAIPKTNPAMFSPNRVIPSAGVFGSLPSGVAENVPWQTLLFRPDPEVSKGQLDRDRQHYGSRYPRDHLFMDMFWMPVVQPYAISEPFETKGKINMNYQILPFTYITRATALHALFKSEKVMAIPDNRTDDYKIGEKEGGENSPYRMPDSTAVFRHFIDADETLEQWEERFAGTDQASISRGIKPGAFISATEICDEWLVPLGQTRDSMVQFWQTHRQTGDNVKERPYANLYPRLTTRSNAYRVHVVAQALHKTRKSDPRAFQPEKGDEVTAEYRGSYLVERSIDPTDPDLQDYATAVANLQEYEPLDKFYFYRISQVKQFVR